MVVWSLFGLHVLASPLFRFIVCILELHKKLHCLILLNLWVDYVYHLCATLTTLCDTDTVFVESAVVLLCYIYLIMVACRRQRLVRLLCWLWLSLASQTQAGKIRGHWSSSEVSWYFKYVHCSYFVYQLNKESIGVVVKYVWLQSNWWAKCLFLFSQDCSLPSGSLALEALLIGVHCKKRHINV